MRPLLTQPPPPRCDSQPVMLMAVTHLRRRWAATKVLRAAPWLAMRSQTSHPLEMLDVAEAEAPIPRRAAVSSEESPSLPCAKRRRVDAHQPCRFSDADVERRLAV